MLDGVYRCGADGAPAFVEAQAPTDDELHTLLKSLITRLMKLLTRRDVLVEEMGQTYLAEPDANASMVVLGMAWVYDQYVTDETFYQYQEEAQAERRGLWSRNDPVEPWLWRRGGR